VRKLTFRQLVVLILALWNDLSQKEIESKAGLTAGRLSQFLTRRRKKEIDDDLYAKLLAVVAHRPAAVSLTTAFVEALDALSQESVLIEEEQAGIEEEILYGAGVMRRFMAAFVLRSRAFQPSADHPHEIELPACRYWAEELLANLKKVHRRSRLAVVRLGKEYQHWALLERCCEESVREASCDLKSAASWARLAMLIVRFVTGPASWLTRLRAYALAHWANILRVQGKLEAAEARLEEAKTLWQAGTDPGGVLDPGRLLDLEGSLRRDQRRFEEALAIFDQAVPVSRFPARILIKKGFTYTVMGAYEKAVATFLEAQPRVEHQGDPRLINMLRLNFASALCHVSRYVEAAELIEEVRRDPEGLGKIDLTRILWLDGRILAGLGRPREARRLLAEARQRFEAEAMAYDVALALLEEAGLLLLEGRTEEVKALTLELAKIFDSKGVHREALAALQTFDEAVQHEEATADLARRVLSFLFKARYDQGLRFES
jgi:tetratricopeptide (TPR) repeat protein